MTVLAVVGLDILVIVATAGAAVLTPSIATNLCVVTVCCQHTLAERNVV